MNDLTRMIDGLVEQKTFGLDALDGVKALRDKASDLEKKLATATAALAEASKTNGMQSDLIRKRDAEISEMREREAALRTRENNVATLEREAAVAKAVQVETREMMKLVFANRQIRESVMVSGSRSEAHPTQGYTNTLPYSNTQTVTREEG